MRVVEGQVAETLNACLVVGNGKEDVKVFTVVAEAYDHRKTILLPTLPVRERDRVGTTGLAAVARALAILVSLQQASDSVYLVLIDLEHVKSLNDVEDKLREHGFDVVETEILGEQCYRVEVKRGSKRATVYVVVSGNKECRSIEAHIVKMIRELYKEEVKCDKKSIWKWLRRRGIRVSELVREAVRRGLISKVFPQLAIALQQLSRDS